MHDPDLRAAGRRAAADLPPLTPEQCRRIAALLREPMNQLLRTERALSVGATKIDRVSK